MTLETTQREFINRILRPLPEGKSEISDENRFLIYQNNCQEALIKTLQNTYDVCYRILEDEGFRKLAEEYIHDFPPTHFNLNFYGEEFSEFIRCHKELGQFTFLADLSHLEWQVHLAYYAQDLKRGFISRLRDALTLTFHHRHFKKLILLPHVALVKATTPIAKIWGEHQKGGFHDLEVTGKGFNVIVKRVYVRDRTVVQVLTLSAKMTECLEEALFKNRCKIRSLPYAWLALANGWVSFSSDS